jgi:hypothetical protein
MPKYGPEGVAAGSKEYFRHLRFCRHHGIQCTYDEYLARVNRGSKYGPPGSRAHSAEVQRHRRWVQRHGWCSWDEYVMRSPRLAAELDHDKIAARVEANRKKLRELGLLAA